MTLDKRGASVHTATSQSPWPICYRPRKEVQPHEANPDTPVSERREGGSKPGGTPTGSKLAALDRTLTNARYTTHAGTGSGLKVNGDGVA